MWAVRISRHGGCLGAHRVAVLRSGSVQALHRAAAFERPKATRVGSPGRAAGRHSTTATRCGGTPPGDEAAPKRKKKLPPAPTPVVKPSFPKDFGVWQNAMVLIDKPQEWTSFDLCGKLRGALKIKKVGHAGTLDPLATGLVIVCVGKGTKHVDNFMAQEKEYTGTIRLGEGTPSYDAESDVEVRLPWEHITDEELLAAREKFLGDIMQVPPMFSAIKIKGQPLYTLARKGETVERPPRAVSISEFSLERDAEDQQSLHFRVICSKGTYIRSLAHDLAEAVGTAGHLTALRRERIGEYSVENAWGIVELADKANEMRRQQSAAAESA